MIDSEQIKEIESKAIKAFAMFGISLIVMCAFIALVVYL